MASLREEFSHLRLKKHEGDYGLEIETEVAKSEDYPKGFFKEHTDEDNGKLVYKFKDSLNTHWIGHPDGSLRGFGMEYVLKKPLEISEVNKALDIFEEETKKIPFIQGTPSTSVHVHLNVVKEGPIQLANFLTAYVLLESILVEFSGETRRSNLFALPVRCAEHSHRAIMSLFKKMEDRQKSALAFSQEAYKYASINLSPLSKFGSVEIRPFRGTTNVSEIKAWVNIIDRLWVYAKSEGLYPNQIPTEYGKKGIDFMLDIFGPYTIGLMSAIDNELDEYVGENLFYAALIGNAIKDWDSLKNFFPKTAKKKGMSFADKKQLVSKTFVQPLNSFLFKNFEKKIRYYVDADTGEPIENSPIYSYSTVAFLAINMDDWEDMNYPLTVEQAEAACGGVPAQPQTETFLHPVYTFTEAVEHLDMNNFTVEQPIVDAGGFLSE